MATKSNVQRSSKITQNVIQSSTTYTNAENMPVSLVHYVKDGFMVSDEVRMWQATFPARCLPEIITTLQAVQADLEKGQNQ